MAKVTLTAFMTLDGVVQAPGGPDEDREGGFEHGGWVAPHFDEELGRFVDETFSTVTGFLLGRRTYEIFAAYWPQVTDADDPVAGRLNTLPKYVASRTLESAGWHNSTLLGGDAVKEVAGLKERLDGELQVHGSGNLAHSLMAHGLIDEYRLMVFPVLLGSGKRLFADGTVPTALEAVESRTTGTGVAIHVYRAAGRPEYGLVGA
ncbi:dihydrofolate reductase family protein [Streptomyces sp. TRM 70361]|uniref:dihydrofolate reductase family protein n=1 Tax=Streptomyces sp. TRM 70361 TaxID=3116553 RepID=UPI002E7BA870|nr:dihydrofolate reductase family protein [Streptomyces sp. TRM 70361]MEE1941306.1 dihydrofolate reductase family protein [Streptomyces sp. TRM 70361]